jgi:hypothetical protein
MKQHKFRYLLIPVIPALLLVTGCKKFGDTNENPDATTQPILNALLTNAEAALSSYAANTRAGFYCQYFSETQYPDASLYSMPQINHSGEYSGILYDLQNIIKVNTNNNMTQVSRILKAYVYWTLTDRWGDLPYTEALAGNPTPAFDAQETIYKGTIAELKDAVVSFDGSLITGDVIFNGDVAKWKKLANSLRMLMALRLSKKYAAAGGYAATEFNAALNDAAGSIDANANNFTIVFPGNFKSNWYSLYDGRKDVGESATLTTLMGNLNDDRQDAFGGATQEQSASDPLWNQPSDIGVPYGRARSYVDAWAQNNPTWARVLRGDLRTTTGSVVIVSAAQVLLARAEAADRGWTSEVALTLYKAGVNASFSQWGIALPANSYFSQTDVAFTAPAGTGANVKPIAIQRYIASYPDGLQGWSEWRRTGYPALTAAPDALNGVTEIPRRYTYGTNEYATNKDNVEARAASMPGGDKMSSKVWWDQ